MFEYLIEIAQKLNLSGTDESSYLIALSDMFNEKHRIETIEFIKTQETHKLNEDLKQLNLFHEALKRDYEKLEFDVIDKKQNSEEIQQDIEFKQRKIEKYNYDIQKFEVFFKVMLCQLKIFETILKNLKAYKQNIDGRLMHESIVDRHRVNNYK